MKISIFQYIVISSYFCSWSWTAFRCWSCEVSGWCFVSLVSCGPSYVHTSFCIVAVVVLGCRKLCVSLRKSMAYLLSVCFFSPVINCRNTLSDAGMAPNPQLIVQGSLCITQLDPRCSVSILVMASGFSQPQGRVSLLHWFFFKHIWTGQMWGYRLIGK